MQQVSAEFQAVLDSDRRNLSTVVEIYPADHIPDKTIGFDPANAVKRYSKVRLTYKGFAYQPRLKLINKVSRFISGKSSNVSTKFSNVLRDYAAFILNSNVDGMWCVVRRLCRSLDDDPGMILFVGKFEKPSDTDKKDGSLEAKQLGSGIDYKLPPRIFQVEDSQGRAIGDPLHDGFPFIPIRGNFIDSVTTESRVLFFFKKKKTTTRTTPYSSFSDTPLGEPIPEIVCGRAQLRGVDVEYVDAGEIIYFRQVLANGKLFTIEDIRKRTNAFSALQDLTIHLGEPGGTGTQIVDSNFPATGLLSGSAYWSAFVTGSSHDGAPDTAPPCTAIGFAGMPLPDGAGDFTLLGPSDNPVYGARNLWTKPQYLNIPAELMDDESDAIEAAYCDEPLIDDSQGERALLPGDILPLTETGEVRRVRSSGTLSIYRYRKLLDLDPGNIDLLIDANLAAINELNPFDTGEPQRVYRKRFTANLAITGESQATDVLHKVLAPAARMYWLTSSKGRVQTKIEKPADSVLLTSSTAIGATLLPVDSVKRWIGNLTGFALVGVGRSEVQRIRITGSPEGGTFALAGAADVPYNATAEEIEIALEGVYGEGNVRVEGRAWVFDVSFMGALSGQPLAQMTATHALTGGTSPNVTIETIEQGTNGIYSEVRRVSGVVYSIAGNDVTLEAAATGSATVSVSGATLADASETTPATGYVRILGAGSPGDIITATIDGIAIAYTVVDGDTTGTIAGQLRDAIASDPELRRYIAASWSVGDPNFVYISALLGSIQLAAVVPEFPVALEFAHGTGEEVIRIMKPFSDVASVQSGCARANILPGTFKFKENKEKTVSQVKGEFIDSRNDFAKTPITINDTPAQRRTRKPVPFEIDLSAVDNVHQARRLARGAFSKHVEGNRFYSWSAGYAAGVLDEGDVICVSERSGGFINIPVRIEDLGLFEDGKTSLDCRIYSTRMYSDEVGPHDIPLPTGLRDRPRGTGETVIVLSNVDYVLTNAEASNRTIRLTGTLTADVSVTFPSVLSDYNIVDELTGAFSITLQVAS